MNASLSEEGSRAWTTAERDLARALARYIVSSAYPKELSVFDMVADAYLGLDSLPSIGGATGLSVAGLPFGQLADLGSLEAVAFVSRTIDFIYELGLAESLPNPDAAYRVFADRPAAQAQLVERAQLPPTEGLGLDSQTAQQFMEMTLDFIGPCRFVLGQTVPFEETQRYELKGPKTPNVRRFILKEVEEYVVGFLNVGGGSIYYGVNDSRVVTGVHLNTHERDKLRGDVNEKLRGIRPSVDPTSTYRWGFHPVVGADDRAITDLYVVGLTVALGPSRSLYRDHKGIAHCRQEGRTIELTETEAEEFLRKRSQ